MDLRQLQYFLHITDIENGELIASQIDGVELTRKFIKRTDRPVSTAVAAITDLIREQFSSLRDKWVFGEQAVPFTLRMAGAENCFTITYMPTLPRHTP